MIDTYLAATDEAALSAFLSFFSQVIGPERGRAAVEADPLAEPPVEAQAAAGDPLMFYACVRLPVSPAGIELPEGIDLVDAELGAAVVGVWA